MLKRKSDTTYKIHQDLQFHISTQWLMPFFDERTIVNDGLDYVSIQTIRIGEREVLFTAAELGDGEFVLADAMDADAYRPGCLMWDVVFAFLQAAEIRYVELSTPHQLYIRRSYGGGLNTFDAVQVTEQDSVEFRLSGTDHWCPVDRLKNDPDGLAELLREIHFSL